MSVVHITNANEFNEQISSGVVLVDFTAQWCGPCQMIGPYFVELSSEYPSILFIKVDVDECADVATECDVSAMPTFYVYKDGQKVDELVGASKDELKALCEKYNQ